MQGKPNDYPQFLERLVNCRACERIVEFRELAAREKRRQYQDWDYWGRPVPGYGALQSRLLLVGLAPARHGGNRTGRVFTGDKSAEFLTAALHRVGMANQATSERIDDGLEIYDTFMTPVVKCVPPGDKPLATEKENCSRWLIEEMNYLPHINCILALGKVAFDSIVRHFSNQFDINKRAYQFGHDREYRLPDGTYLISSYHPSPRNVNTGRLTNSMLDAILIKARNCSRKK